MNSQHIILWFLVIIANPGGAKLSLGSKEKVTCGGGGWVKRDDMCYLVNTAEKKITWLEAKRRCRELNGDLATIRGQSDEDALSRDIKKAYIGLRKDYTPTAGNLKDIFRWQDGSSVRHVNWKDNEPDGSFHERCVLMDGSRGWADIVCGKEETNQFICMKTTLIKSHLLGETIGITRCKSDDIDLTFMVDSSNSVRRSDFEIMLLSIQDIIRYFNTDDGHLRTAVVTFGKDVKVEIYLNQYKVERNLLAAIANIRHRFQPLTDIGLGLALVKDEIYREENGHRPQAFKLLILLTDGISQDSVKTSHEAARAREFGIFIIAIGIGPRVNPEELLAVTARDEAVLIAENFQELGAVTAATLVIICPVCNTRDGWLYHDEMCYLVHAVNEKITWLEARRRCREVNGDLTSLRGSRDENFLLSKMSREIPTAYVGLRKSSGQNPGKLEDVFRWQDGTPLIYKHWKNKEPDGAYLQRCVLMNGSSGWEDTFCGERVTNQFICMKPAVNKTYRFEATPELPVSTASMNENILRNCTNGEVVSTFSFCDKQFDCSDKSDEANCGDVCGYSMYTCLNQRCISLTYYCDGVNDCGDNSDEETCRMTPCSDQEWTCQNGQCIADHKRCNLYLDCLDKSDEEDCDVCRGFECYDGTCIPETWVNDGVVDCDGFRGEDESVKPGLNPDMENSTSVCMYQPDMFGKVSLHLPQDGRNCAHFDCPDTFYKCPASYCIPVGSVCNDVFDCPHGEDEYSCYSFTCPGYYRCQEEMNCIHTSQVCDGLRHCPKGDDERNCVEYTCPPACVCQGRVIRCGEGFNHSSPVPTDVRKLDLSGLVIETDLLDLNDLPYLTVLILSHCNITDVEEALPDLPNLLQLDLSSNRIQILSNTSFGSVRNLKVLDISQNTDLDLIQEGAFAPLHSLEHLKLQKTGLRALKGNVFLGLSNLRSLDLSMNDIHVVMDNAFSGLEKLYHLDIRRNDIKQFGKGILNGLKSLGELLTDSFQLCCDAVRPKSLHIQNCKSSARIISSCTDLLGEDILRNMLWFIAVISVLGNVMVLVYRFRYDKKSLQRSYGVFVTNLCVSDCFMGIYMLIIGGADVWYRDTYIWNDYGWRHSALCKAAGFLATVSSEASCLFITLITLDRLLAVRFPFRQVRFTCVSTTVCIIITWIVAVALAGLPLLPSLTHWEFYAQNSVCLALPLSSEKKPGWAYSGGLFVGFNFILFLLIGIGQVLIYNSIKPSSGLRVRGDSDAKVARRLFLVVLTDFMCWVPVGIMGIVAVQGIPIDREVYAWTAVTILPINSALNPILYTVPGMIQTRREMVKRRRESDRKTSGSQGTSVPGRVMTCKTYVGNPTNEMETLRSILIARDLGSNVKIDLLTLIVAYVLDLQQNGRRFHPISDEDVFVRRCGQEISAVCLSLKADLDRDNMTEDVLYLIQLMKSHGNESQSPQEHSNTEDLQEFTAQSSLT